MHIDQVFVDVHPWVKATEERGHVPFTGVFRQAKALCSMFTPAVTLPSGEKPLESGLRAITSRLNKTVRVFHPDEVEGVWLSLGVDQIDIHNYPRNAFRVALLLDAMSADGKFGPDALKRFQVGAAVNSAFLYISDNALEAFNEAVRKDSKV